MGEDPAPPFPTPEVPSPSPTQNPDLLSHGSREKRELAEASPELHRHYNWLMRFVMKPALFFFVLGLNVWWDWNVMRILWQAGRAGAGFHLGDPVLIALITTSIANFLVLIHVVAKHLFPSQGAAAN